jgi:hypothetical protein
MTELKVSERLKRQEQTIDREIFALRDHEKRSYFEVAPDNKLSYAVMLWNAPAFPGMNVTESQPLLLCAAYTLGAQPNSQNTWVWLHLDPYCYDLIREDLAGHRATPGQWYYMMLSDGVGHRASSHGEYAAGPAEFYFTPRQSRPLKWWEPLMRWLVQKSAGR